MNMAKGQGKTGLIITIIVLGLTLLIVGGFVIWQNGQKTDTMDVSSQSTSTDTQPGADSTDETNPEATVPPVTDTSASVDPATLSSIVIEPLAITASYTKGIPGFEFAVKRSADGTQYVEFSAPELVGTKCTNDTGVFASIIKGVNSTEDSSTVSQKKTINDVIYGLSLTGPDCTSNAELLKDYQSAFTNGFSQLLVNEE